MWLEARQGSCLLEASTLRMPSVSLFPWDPKPQCQVRGPSPGWDWSEPGGWAGEWPSPLFAACSSKQPPMCMMFDPFAGASQRPLLIPPTSPPLPSSPPRPPAVSGSIPPASTNHCDRKAPLSSVPWRRSSWLWQRGVPHTPGKGLGLPRWQWGRSQAASKSSWDVLGPGGGTWLREAPGDPVGG